jgi:hypothetical protein
MCRHSRWGHRTGGWAAHAAGSAALSKRRGSSTRTLVGRDTQRSSGAQALGVAYHAGWHNDNARAASSIVAAQGGIAQLAAQSRARSGIAQAAQHKANAGHPQVWRVVYDGCHTLSRQSTPVPKGFDGRSYRNGLLVLSRTAFRHTRVSASMRR